jgi:hypothetical protein
VTVSLSRSSVPNPNDDPASTIEQLSVPNDGPASTIQQLYVPNNGPAHFKQLSVPMTAPQAFSATTATTTATMTQVPATRTATTNAPRNQLVKCEATQTQHKTRSPSILHPVKKAANYATQRNLLLYFVQNDPAISISGLLLPHNFECSAITTTKNANFSLQLIVKLLSTGTKQVAPANSKLHLIVVFI